MATAKVYKGFINALFDSKYDDDSKAFYIKGTDGAFSLPKDKAKDLQKGDTVTVKAVKTKNGFTVKAIKVTEKSKGGYGGRKGGGGGGGYQKDPNVQKAIVMQHSQSTAVAEVVALIAAGVKMPAAAKLEAWFNEQVVQRTEHLYAEAYTQFFDPHEYGSDDAEDEDEEDFDEDEEEEEDEEDEEFDDEFDED